MVFNKRKRFSRRRGSHTHGCGSKKKRRGKGNRGGVGMAGTGKRSDQKLPSIWKYDYFGKRGFVNVRHKDENVINIIDLELGSFKPDDKGIIDLKKMGYDKLLGKGRAAKKYIIVVDKASAHAVEKIKEASGEVRLSSSPKPQHEVPDKKAGKKTSDKKEP